jgi:hypothetical protein
VICPGAGLQLELNQGSLKCKVCLIANGLTLFLPFRSFQIGLLASAVTSEAKTQVLAMFVVACRHVTCSRTCRLCKRLTHKQFGKLKCVWPLIALRRPTCLPRSAECLAAYDARRRK